MNFFSLYRYIGLFLITLNAYAVDIPTVVEGSENFSKEQCIASNTNDCIQSVCMTSSDLDCNVKCKEGAEDKCEELADE